MKNYLQAQIYSLLLISILINSCSEKVKTNICNNSDSVSTAIANGRQKLPKAKGLNTNPIIGYGIQDKSGNRWFVSNGEGVYRYDGKTFINFTMEDGLDTNIVYSILEDKTGVIWIGTCKGLNRYDGKKFKRIPIISTKGLSFYPVSSFESPIQNRVWSIMQDSKGTIWIGSDEGVYCYTPGKQATDSIRFTPFLDNKAIGNPGNLQLRSTFSILEDKAGAIWFGTCVNEGISRFDGKNLINIAPQKDVGRVNRIIEDANENIWFTTTLNSVCCYDGKSFIKNFFKVKEGKYDYIVKDESGSIWFDTNNGIGYYNNKTFTVYTEKDGFPSNNIAPILSDKLGKMWFFGEAVGLYLFDEKTFTKFSE